MAPSPKKTDDGAAWTVIRYLLACLTRITELLISLAMVSNNQAAAKQQSIFTMPGTIAYA